jgi:hypothetical protein
MRDTGCAPVEGATWLLRFMGSCLLRGTGRVNARYKYIGVVGRSQNRFPMVSLDFSVTYSFPPHHGPGVDSSTSENEYHEHFLGVKAAGAWDWQTHHLHVLNIMESWEHKPTGTLWATRGLLRESFTFTYIGVSGDRLGLMKNCGQVFIY